MLKKLLAFLVMLFIAGQAWASTETSAVNQCAGTSCAPTFAGLTSNSTVEVVGNVGIGTATGDSYVTNTPPNGGMQIEGNVGIGTNVPYSLLDVEGTLRNAVFFANGKTASSGFSNVGIGTLAPIANLQISGSKGLIVTTGNVGIGTTFINGTGEAQLSVMGGNVGIGTWLPTNPFVVGNNNFVVMPNGNVGLGTWQPMNPFQIGVGEKPTFTISSSGNIGIGTDIASSVFSANGNTAGGLSFLVKNLNAAGYGGFFFINDSGDEGGFTQDGSTNSFGPHQFQLGGYTSTTPVAIYSGNAQAIFIDTNQNVGIGTLAPTAAFVIGTDASNAGLNHIMCVGAGNCVGYTTGTITPVGGTTTTCTCLPK